VTTFGKFLFKNKNGSTESNNEYHGYVEEEGKTRYDNN
jgi:hypothetical protein